MNLLFWKIGGVILQAVLISATAIINPLSASSRHDPSISEGGRVVSDPGSRHLGKRDWIPAAVAIIEPLSGTHRQGPMPNSRWESRSSAAGAILNPLTGSTRLGPIPRSQPPTPSGEHVGKKGAGSARVDDDDEGGPLISLPMIPWTPKNNVTLQWSAEISVGTPPQKFNVILDTGSPIPLLLPLSTCPTCNRSTSSESEPKSKSKSKSGGQLEQRPHNLFDPSLSSTFTPTNPAIPVRLSFGSAGGGTVPYSTPQGANCTVVSDTLTVGAYKIKDQQFLVSDEYSEGLRDQFADGILGLSSVTSGAWPDGNQTGYGGVLAGLAGVKEFSVDFEQGRIVFGGSDRGGQEGVKKVKLEEELSKSRGGWVVETRWEGGDHDHDHDGGGEEAEEAAVALLDTGSAVMVTPDFDTARRLYGSMSRDIRPIDSLGSWGVECEVWEKMGRDVKFVVGGSRREKVEVVVKKEFLNVGEYPGQPGICQGLFLHPLTQAREPLRGRPAWIVGNALLRGYVTVWNWEEMSVGFGKVRENPEEKKRCGRKASR